MASMLVACTASINSDNAVPKNNQNPIVYPVTLQGDVIDNYFGTQVADPYRWLEDDRSVETASWVKSQNRVTNKFLAQIPYREQLQQRLSTLWNYEKISAPFKEGRYNYFYKNDGLQNQDVLYRQIIAGGEAEVFLDPNKFSDDGTTSLASISFSKNGAIAAYAISEGGSDWRKIIIIDTDTKAVIAAPLVDVKFSDISWYGNEGFYYSSYDKPTGSELSAKTDQHKLYFHRLGTSQQQDQVVFGATAEQKHRYVGGSVSQDDRYLLIYGAESTSGNRLYLKDLTKDNAPLVTIMSDISSDSYLLTNQGSTLYLVTNLHAPNKKIVTVDANTPTPEHWVDFIPETEHVLSATTGGGYIFTEYMVDAISQVYQYDYHGKKIRALDLPGLGSVSGISGKKEAQTLYYSFTNYKTPATIYSVNLSNGDTALYQKSGAQFTSDAYTSEQIFYQSKDGTQVPMMITYKKGLKRDGKNPTMLYGYGGFNISLTPSFSVARAVWLELGGIYAVANLRGGGEYGDEWHNAGTQQQKQNVFDDFIAAGEYLITQQYTSSDFLAVSGRSNGGLLVGSVLTQRPDLMKVALPAVGVLDMLRYHTFTAGAGWAYDYGTAEQSEAMFNYLKGYSPVHNVNAGVKYPATLVTTGDHDDRVVPAHSFKFAAQLQAKQAGMAPTMIRIETNAGHGAGTPVSKTIAQYADIYGFTLFNMGFTQLPQ